MAKVPTVAVVDGKGYRVINESNFVEGEDKLYEGPLTEAADPETETAEEEVADEKPAAPKKRASKSKK